MSTYIYIHIYIYLHMYIYRDIPIWRFPYMGVPQNGGFIRANPIKMNDFGVSPFQETSI